MKGLFAFLLAALAAGCQFCDRHKLEARSQIIRVESGHRYHIELVEDAAAGYAWDWSCSDSDVEVVMEHRGPPEPKPGESAPCGDPGKASVTIRIHRGFDGPSSVRFFYRRPQEREPVRQFTVALYKRTGDAAFWKD